jgi:hypothetical protein
MCRANAHKIYWKYCIFQNSWQTELLFIDSGAPFDYVPFPTLAMASEIDGNGIFVLAAGFVPILTIFFFIIDALVVDQQSNSFQ